MSHYVGNFKNDAEREAAEHWGWIVGKFFPGTPRLSHDVEIKYWEFPVGVTDHPKKVSATIEITFILSGKVVAIINDETKELVAGDYVVLQPGTPNNLVSEILEPTTGLTIKAPSDPSAKKVISDDNEELLDLVNDNDEVIGKTTKKEAASLAKGKSQNVRVVEAFVVRSDGALWVPKRSMEKRIAPGGLDYSIAGHVGSGSSYEDALVREAQEESGLHIAITDATLIAHVPPSNTGGCYFSKLYAVHTDEQPTLSKEHTSGEWMQIDELLRSLEGGMPAKELLKQNVELLANYVTAQKS
ncbi:MAG: NUDIX domain-containing protein [Candidatus Saccharimonadales bacterium]